MKSVSIFNFFIMLKVKDENYKAQQKSKIYNRAK